MNNTSRGWIHIICTSYNSPGKPTSKIMRIIPGSARSSFTCSFRRFCKLCKISQVSWICLRLHFGTCTLYYSNVGFSNTQIATHVTKERDLGGNHFDKKKLVTGSVEGIYTTLPHPSPNCHQSQKLEFCSYLCPKKCPSLLQKLACLKDWDI